VGDPHDWEHLCRSGLVGRPRRCQTNAVCEQDHAAAAKGQIQLLLEEYSALRSEIDQRIGARATLVGFIAAGAAFIVGSHISVVAWIAAAVFLVILIVAWGSSTAMLGRIGKELKN
jgi:hypothetical protein